MERGLLYSSRVRRLTSTSRVASTRRNSWAGSSKQTTFVPQTKCSRGQVVRWRCLKSRKFAVFVFLEKEQRLSTKHQRRACIQLSMVAACYVSLTDALVECDDAWWMCDVINSSLAHFCAVICNPCLECVAHVSRFKSSSGEVGWHVRGRGPKDIPQDWILVRTWRWVLLAVLGLIHLCVDSCNHSTYLRLWMCDWAKYFNEEVGKSCSGIHRMTHFDYVPRRTACMPWCPAQALF